MGEPTRQHNRVQPGQRRRTVPDELRLGAEQLRRPRPRRARSWCPGRRLPRLRVATRTRYQRARGSAALAAMLGELVVKPQFSPALHRPLPVVQLPEAMFTRPTASLRRSPADAICIAPVPAFAGWPLRPPLWWCLLRPWKYRPRPNPGSPAVPGPTVLRPGNLLVSTSYYDANPDIITPGVTQLPPGVRRV